MLVLDIVREGGWTTGITQGTVINPKVVADVMAIMQTFTNDLNKWLSEKGIQNIQMGRPLGSTAYYEKDQTENPDKVYGDIDLQMIAPAAQTEPNDQSHSRYTAYWNKVVAEFIKERRPKYVHPTETTLGHPIIKMGENNYVQIDFMWHTPDLAAWGTTRATPERGLKGAVLGNLYSSLGLIMGMSIQHAGVQIKLQKGQPVSFSKQKDVELVTISKNPKTFLYDIFQYLAESILGGKTANIDDRLRLNPGVDLADVKISKFIEGIKGLAQSFEKNQMYGKSNLANISSYGDFINKLLEAVTGKIQKDISSQKREKAATADAEARAEQDKKKLQDGLAMVIDLFRS